MGKSAPSAPDPYATAQAQAQANVQTAQTTAALDRYDQQTPWGSLTWSQPDPTNNPNHYVSTTTVSQPAQNLINDALNTSTQLQQGIGNLTTDVNNSMANQPKVPTLSGAPNLQDVNLGGVNLTGSNLLSSTQPQLALAQGMTGATAGTLAQALGNANNNLSGGLSYANTPGVPTLDANTVGMQQDAQFAKQMQLLQPQLQQQDASEANKLWSMGLTPGDEAYNNEMSTYNAGRNNLLSNVANNAVTGGLQSAEGLNASQLANQQQAVSQDNSLYSLPASVAAQLAGAYGTASGTTTPLYSTQLGQAGLVNNQELSQQGFNNNAQLQQAGFNNGVATTTTNMNNSAAQGNYQNQVGAQQQLLNALASLRSGTQVSQPMFAGENTGTQVAQTPLASSVYNTAAMNNQYAGQTMGGLGSLLGAGISNIGDIASLF